MIIVVLGPPGSGKGTRARLIGQMCQVPLIVMGDILRDAVSEGSEEGKRAKGYMERGELVPDDLVIGLLEEKLRRLNLKRGFVLDGFPRNLKQAEALDHILRDEGADIDLVLNVVVKDDVIVERLSLRRSCPHCGAIYHLKDKPPLKDEICDECGSRLIQRSDDREDVIRHRIMVYYKETKPVLDRYIKMGKVVEISGELMIDKIPDELKKILHERRLFPVDKLTIK
ncbi:adenylate kinase [Candidatus Bathyarchaeota archaeon]|nr:adenylate kinase [Candidatus Bathyarchaeota archaeon]